MESAPEESGSDRKSYDVYINFEAGSRDFTTCLLFGLDAVGIRSFNELEISPHEGAKPVGDVITEAIDNSKIAIVVFSERYAKSTWCLNELTGIVERMESNRQMLLPVYYGVKPRDVRRQEGSFGKGLAGSERRIEPATAQRWRKALRAVGQISGWTVPNRKVDGNLLRGIVQHVSSLLSNNTVHAPPNLVEIESSKIAMRSLLDLNNDDVFMVGICGMGGIGKTAMAKAIYGEIAHFFECHFFLANVREICEKYLQLGLLQLQRKLLATLMINEMDVPDIDRGVDLIKERLCYKRTLLIIDDADDQYQLRALAGACNWFGPRSRIIITTRDRHILRAHQVKKVYEVPLLGSSDAHRLFTATVFQDTRESEDYRNLVNEAVNCAEGLPLAITVLGGTLCGKSKSGWEDILKRWKSSLHPEILSILRPSFDSLNYEEQNMFLDIACFFKGQPVNYVKRVLECCYDYPHFLMEVLEDKYLISIRNDIVDTHEMLTKMGTEIVRQELSKYPHNCRRLWDPNDILEVLTSYMGTSKVEGIKLKFDAPQAVSFSPHAFKGMKGLRVLIVHNACPQNPIYLPKGVKWLEWPEYQLTSLPLDCKAGGKLLGLYMSKSNIQLLQDDLKAFSNLKFINFSYCTSLRIIPDLSSLTNLESLDVEGCKSLVEVHQSLGELAKLVHLNFLNCHNLHTFPISIHSADLQDLILKGCLKLTKFPEIPVNIRSLKELCLNETGIDELPSSIENLIGLKELYLENCKSLEILPSSIYRLQSLQRIFLAGCSELHEFPIYADGLNTSSAALMPVAFPAVANLELQGCGIQQIDFIKDFDCVFSLKNLDLSGSKLVAVPECIDKFIILQQLNLGNCKHLHEIRGLPPNIKYLSAQGCESLEWCVPISRILKSHLDESPRLRQIDFSGCDKLTQNKSSVVNFLSIEGLFGDSQIKILYPGSEIPMWFVYRSKEGSLGFSVESWLYQKIAGLAFCIVIGLAGNTAASFSCEFQVYINHKKTYDTAEFFHPLDSDHLWLVYVPCAGIGGWETKMQNMCNKFRVQFDLSRGNLKCCGVHLVLKKEETNESTNVMDTLEDDE